VLEQVLRRAKRVEKHIKRTKPTEKFA